MRPKPTRNLVENVVLKDNDREVNDPATVASLFNQYFSRIAVDLTKGFQPQNSTSDVFLKVLDTMFVSETSSYEILKIIGKLKKINIRPVWMNFRMFVKDVRASHYTPVNSHI